MSHKIIYSEKQSTVTTVWRIVTGRSIRRREKYENQFWSSRFEFHTLWISERHFVITIARTHRLELLIRTCINRHNNEQGRYTWFCEVCVDQDLQAPISLWVKGTMACPLYVPSLKPWIWSYLDEIWNTPKNKLTKYQLAYLTEGLNNVPVTNVWRQSAKKNVKIKHLKWQSSGENYRPENLMIYPILLARLRWTETVVMMGETKRRS
jgi:hypothetical protein